MLYIIVYCGVPGPAHICFLRTYIPFAPGQWRESARDEAGLQRGHRISNVLWRPHFPGTQQC